MEMAAKASQLPDKTNTETVVVDGGYLVEAIPAREREETPVKGAQNQRPDVVIKAVGPEEVVETEDEDADDTTDEIAEEAVEEDVNLDETNDSLIVFASHVEHSICKGKDVQETDWTIDADADVEWYFYSGTNSGCQYLVTRITNYILWFIPYSYAEFVYELPGGTYADGELDDSQVVVLINELARWDSYSYLKEETRFSRITFECNGSSNKFDFGSSDYMFIVTKDDV